MLRSNSQLHNTASMTTKRAPNYTAAAQYRHKCCWRHALRTGYDYTLHTFLVSFSAVFWIVLDLTWVWLAPQTANKINIMTYGLQQINGITLIFSLLRGTVRALPQM